MPKCGIWGTNIGWIPRRVVLKDGTICMDCAKKAKVEDYVELPNVTVSEIREWIEQPHLKEEREAKRQEQIKQFERERFSEGRVHAKIVQVSFTEVGAAFNRGNALDMELQSLQDRGCQIMNVSCFTSGSDNRYVQAIIVYRAMPSVNL